MGRRPKKKKKKRILKPINNNRCINCNEYGSHFVPPSFGEEGFFLCKKKDKKEQIKENDIEMKGE